MALGVLDLTADTVEELRERDIAELSDLISVLFAKSKPKDNITTIRKFIDNAIELKREMTGDHAVYRCFFPDSNQNPDDTGEDHDHPTPISICTFPGLLRHVLSDDGKMEQVLVAEAVTDAELPLR
jgi:hypothetical protein